MPQARVVVCVLRTEVRRGWVAWVVLGVGVGLVVGLVLVLASGARRTASAFDRFAEGSQAADVTLEVFDLALSREIAESPEVAQVARWFVVPKPVWLLDEADRPVRLPALVVGDRNFGVGVDKPHVTRGRAPVRSPWRSEALASRDWLRAFGVEVGDRIRLWVPPRFDGPVLPDVSAGRVVTVDVVGEAVLFAADVAPDGLTQPSRLYVDHWLAARLSNVSPPVVLKALEGGSALGLRLAPGQDPHRFATRLAARPDVAFTPVVLDDNRRRVADAVRPHVMVLWSLAVALAAAGAAILGPAVYRQSAADARNHSALRALGADHRLLDRLAAARSAVTALVAGAVALGVVAVTSPLIPIGPVADIDSGTRVDPTVLAPGLAVAVTATAAVAVGAARRQTRTVRGTARPGRAARLSARLPVIPGLGVVFAFPSSGPHRSVMRSARTALALALFAVAGLAVLDGSFGQLFGHPNRYGWGWDLALTCNDGRCHETSRVAAAVSRLDDVEAWSYATFTDHTTRVGDVTIPLVAHSGPPEGRSPVVLLEGQAPIAVDEVALGTATMDALAADIGDTVTLTSPHSRVPVRVRVVGRAVFSGLGFDDAHHPSLGVGAAVTPTLLGRLSDTKRDPSHLLVDADGDPSQLRAQLRSVLLPRIDILEPKAPGVLFAWQDLRPYPTVLAALILILAVGTIVHALAFSGGVGHRQLATLRAFGLSRKQARSVIACQAAALLAIPAAVAIPLGVAAGRAGFHRYAQHLGFSSPAALELSFPAAGLVVAMMLAVAVRLIASSLMATPADALRHW